MLRLSLVFFLLNLLAESLFAQPPVALVGQAELVCATKLEEKQLKACPNLPLPNSNIDYGSLRDLPSPTRGFDIIHAALARGDERGEGYYIFGETLYPSNGPYLAFAPEGEMINPNSWEIFAGRGLSGSINWVRYEQWSNANGADGKWNPGDRAKLFASEKTCRSFKTEWNEALSRWLMLYGCSNSTWIRVAAKPSGPWSDAIKVMNAQSGDIPQLLARHQTPGPQHQGSRTTTIYWYQGKGSTKNHRIYTATLRQEGEQ